MGAAEHTVAPDVAVCVVTYRRPDGLDRLCRVLVGLSHAAAGRAHLVVVDNDAAGGGVAVVARHRDALAAAGWELRCVVEERRGLAAVRNRALAELTAIEPVPAFHAWIDDDEVPAPDWLDASLAVAAARGADVVQASVRPVFPPGTPAWVAAGGFFAGSVRAEGPFLANRARTSGVLVRTAALPEPGPEGWFDARFSASGGEDRDLFMRMAAAGARVEGTVTTHVEDHVAPEKTTVRWLLRRTYRYGVVRSATLAEPTVRRRLRRLAGSLAIVASGLGRAVVGCRRGRAAVVVAGQRVSFGVGCIVGLAGLRVGVYGATVVGR